MGVKEEESIDGKISVPKDKVLEIAEVSQLQEP